jgi:hypothetical protein
MSDEQGGTAHGFIQARRWLAWKRNITGNSLQGQLCPVFRTLPAAGAGTSGHSEKVLLAAAYCLSLELCDRQAGRAAHGRIIAA